MPHSFNSSGKKKGAKKGPLGGIKKPTSARDLFTRSLGANTRAILDTKKPIPKISYPKGMRRNFSRRIFNSKTSTLKPDKAINRIYRASFPKQDELFSTALTREFVKGFFEKHMGKTLNKNELDYLDELLDMASAARIPTQYSGFATKDEVMQHPSNRASAVFADPYDTASLHSEMDVERRTYVERAMERSIKAGAKDAAVVIRDGVKAAIEYTLNYFTAPITAGNVQPFSRGKNKPVNDKNLREQLKSRERMKKLYEELGGSLRSLSAPETAPESLTRLWGIGRAADGNPLEAPPSPRRIPDGPEMFA